MVISNDELKKNSWLIISAFVLYLFDPFYIFFTVPLHLYGLMKDEHIHTAVSAVVLALLIIVRELLTVRGVQLNSSLLFILLLGLSPPLMLVLAAAVFHTLRMRQLPVSSLQIFLAIAAVVEVLGFSAVLLFESGMPFAVEARAAVEQTVGNVFTALYGEQQIRGFFSSGNMVSYVIGIVKKSFLLVFAVQFGISIGFAWELYKRLSGRRSESLLAAVKLPEWMIWPFLTSWALVLLDIIFKLGGITLIGWNIGLVLAVCYMLNGLAVYQHIMQSKRGRTVSGFRLMLLVVLMQFIPVVNILVLVLLTGLGVSELWISYNRNNVVKA